MGDRIPIQTSTTRQPLRTSASTARTPIRTSSTLTVEFETAIRRVSWATAQVGQKSLQSVVVDFVNKTHGWSYTTGKTHVPIIGTLDSARDDFRLIRPRFEQSGAFSFSVKGETASGVRIMPNINYRFDVVLSPGRITFSGEHDGYPSYSIVIDGVSVYDRVQGHIGELLGDSDVTVGPTSRPLNR